MTDVGSYKQLPPCGIYRTTAPLPGKEEWVRENLLVYFHNHSQQGPPLLLLPATNGSNRWVFHEKGYLIRDPDYVETLVKLMDEGLYVLAEPIYLFCKGDKPTYTGSATGSTVVPVRFRDRYRTLSFHKRLRVE